MVQKSKRPPVAKIDALVPPKRRGRPRAYQPDVALGKALDLFRKDGFAATSLDDLSAATGMDRMGYGSSETLARSLGLITIICTVLYSIPPTSILGAILLTGYLGGAMASHVRIGSPLFTHTLFGLYLGLMLWGGLWLRDRSVRELIPFRR